MVVATTRFPHDKPASADALLPGCVGLLGERFLEGFSTPPMTPTFAPVFLPEWHAERSARCTALVYLESWEQGAPVHKVNWATYATWQRKAAAHVAKALEKALGHDVATRFWQPDAPRFAGLREERMAPVVAIVASGDPLAYDLLVNGIERLGLIPLLVSANNSAPAIAHLLAVCNVQAVMRGAPDANTQLDARLDAALDLLEDGRTEVSRKGFRPALVPWAPFEQLTAPDAPALEPPSPLPAFEAQRVFLLLHSSGTTSLFPKPIAQRQHAMLSWLQAALTCDASDEQKALFTGRPYVVSHLPPAHAMGSALPLFGLYSGTQVAFGPPGNPPPMNGHNLLNLFERLDNGIPIVPPALLEAIAADPKLLKRLQRWSCAMFGGGGLPHAAAQKMRDAGVEPLSVLGSTEAGVMSRWNTPLGDDVPLLAIEGNLSTALRFRKLGDEERAGAADGDDEYELIIAASGGSPHATPAVYNCEWEGEKAYATGDRVRLFAPNKRNGAPRFMVVGRIDPGIVLSTGEKTNPEPMLKEIHESDAIDTALMFGQGRQYNGLLVMPAKGKTVDVADAQQLAAFRDEIAPFVEKANAVAPTHSAIYKEMIVVASPDKPFEYTAKGSLRTAATLLAYDDEINRAYDDFEGGDGATGSKVEVPSEFTADSALAFVHAATAEALRRPQKDVPVDADLFRSVGADSLVANRLRTVLQSALRSQRANGSGSGSDAPLVSSDFVYSHPTVQQMADELVSLASGKKGANAQNRTAEAIQRLIEKYTGNWPTRAAANGNRHANGHAQSGHVFAVTGTTGGAGAHFLAQLARRDDVRKVFAINRASSKGSLLERQQDALRSRGEPESVAKDSKVVLLEADTTDQDRLGLPQETYDEMRATVTHIIHNAWQLNFNMSVSSFEPHIAGVRSLALLALRSTLPSPPRFLLISSIATTMGWSEPRKVPEIPLDPSLAGNGYGQSKAVAEKILEDVHKQRGLDVATARGGQLAGSTTSGAWATTDWLPMLLKSAQTLHCLPAVDGDIFWIPMDRFSGSIIDFALSEEKQLPPVFHVVSPKGSPWNNMISIAASDIGAATGSKVRVVPAEEWVAALSKAAAEAEADGSGDDVARVNPAVKLLPTYQGMLRAPEGTDVPREAFGTTRLDTKISESLSPTLRETQAISDKDVRKSLQYWRKAGFLA